MAERLSKMAVSQSFPDSYRSLSRRLERVLEDIGASTVIRNIWKKHNRSLELLQPLLHNRFPKGSFFIVGSSYEGTTTLGLNSDIDILLVLEDVTVVIDIQEAQQYNYCLLVIQDSNTPAGYVKLQGCVNGVPRFKRCTPCDLDDAVVDKESRYVFTNTMFPVDSLNFGEFHGPAVATGVLGRTTDVDYIPALRCHRWPDMASEWLTRQRHNGWPNPVLTQKCKTLGCIFVQAGHPVNDEKHLQWRLSFSLQERLLATHFNATQLKCYILMKLFGRDIMKTQTLSSYHWKTCLLYMIEDTPSDIWQEGRLLECFHLCLQRMLESCHIGVFRNYFIPEENMFEGRIQRPMQEQLSEELRNLFESDFAFLLQIRSDQVGTRLLDSLSLTIANTRFSSNKIFVMNYLLHVQVIGILQQVNACLQYYGNRSTRYCIRGLLTLKEKLKRIEQIPEETQKTIAVVLSYIDLNLMTTLVVLADNFQMGSGFLEYLLLSDCWDEISLKADSFSSKLKQASCLYMLKQYESSLGISLHLKTKVNDQLLSVCGCFGTSGHNRVDVSTNLHVQTMEELLHQYVIPCITFFPAEKNLLPPAIFSQMARPLADTPDGRVEVYDMVQVDGKIFLDLLLFLNHRALTMVANAGHDIEDMESLVSRDNNLVHRETDLNLLGWMYKEMGHDERAIACFTASLVIKPENNVAYNHLTEMRNLQCSLNNLHI